MQSGASSSNFFYRQVLSQRVFSRLVLMLVLLGLAGCMPRQLIVRSLADELAQQGTSVEEDLGLAREASAFYLKLSEGLLSEVPGHAGLATAVASGFAQYAYAFVATEAEKAEGTDVKAAAALRKRAAALYRRARNHAMLALETRRPGLRAALAAPAAQLPSLAGDELALAYWACASWGGYIALSKDDPDAVADLPLAQRLLALAYAQQPQYGEGALASLMGSFEAGRPGGSAAAAARYFDEAIALSKGQQAGPFVAKAEALSLSSGDRAEFEALLRQALAASVGQRDLANAIQRQRAQWLLSRLDDLF
jgi:TRAP transporter T-component